MIAKLAVVMLCWAPFVTPLVTTLEAQRAAGRDVRIRDVAELVVADAGPSNRRYSVYRYEGNLVSGDMSVVDYRRAIAAAAPLVVEGERIFEVVVGSALQPSPGFPADLEVRTCSNCGFLTGTPDAGAGRAFRFRRAENGFALVSTFAWMN